MLRCRPVSVECGIAIRSSASEFDFVLLKRKIRFSPNSYVRTGTKLGVLNLIDVLSRNLLVGVGFELTVRAATSHIKYCNDHEHKICPSKLPYFHHD